VKRAKRGRLIALDGSAAGLTLAARDVLKVLAADTPRGISTWDASGIFTELFAEEGLEAPSARTLTLLYAADLAFRLRWQIVPALEEGHVVVAAPYVETARALGLAAGLSRHWLDHLFRFAPRPDASYHVPPTRARHDVAPGYFECFSAALGGSDFAIEPATLKKRSLEYLASLEKRRRSVRLTPAALKTASGRVRGSQGSRI
jgi:hypothetical protein